MSKPKVFIGIDLPKEIEEYIGEYCEYTLWDGEDNINYNEVLNNIHDVEGVLLPLIKIDENLLNHAPKLKVVSNLTVGYNNFDLDIMRKKKIIGTNAAGSSNDTVSDLIFGLILGAARRIPELDGMVKDGKWVKKYSGSFYGKDVSGTSLGIIGMGRIGEEVAKRASLGFNMEVNYYNRNRKKDIEKKLNIKYLDFDSLLKKSDFIVAMTPLTDETYHLIDKREFSLMKKDSIFINASRGSVVNEEALIWALRNKEIWAAGLDVFEHEPIDKNNPLLKMSNVITLPHIGASTYRTLNRMKKVAAENLVQALKGETPDNLVPELRCIYE